ncbi:MAG: hypothetical protein ACRELG_25350 [Gemmataceae bacterium]
MTIFIGPLPLNLGIKPPVVYRSRWEGAGHSINAAAPANDQAFLIRWSIQEIRRIALKLAQQRIQPAHVIAWSLWRRAHQAAARRAHLKKQQL